MPRPKSIPWQKRVSIFVDYRRSGKVLPTSKLHGVARSTVSRIIKEFVDEGFSTKPRPNLPPEMLCEIQEKHLDGLLALMRGSESDDPLAYEIGPLNLGPTADDEEERQRVEKAPVFISEEAAWHLKDTEAEQVLIIAQIAVRDNVQRWREAWRDLRSELESACELPELPQLPEVRDMEPEPRILPELGGFLSRSFTDPAFKKQPPSFEWLNWGVPDDARSVLRLHGQYVAVGSAEDHKKVKRGVARFIAENFREYQRRFLELHHLRRDLHLMDQITEQKRAEISESDVRQSICPACPYPEASVTANTSKAPLQPAAKEGK